MRPVDEGCDVTCEPLATERSVAHALRSLPHPLHLLERAFGTGHYHLGLFDSAAETIGTAQDRMSASAADAVQGSARVLDIGCGLGGTSRLLQQRGARVTALEPDPLMVRFARRSRGQVVPSTEVTFECKTLAEFSRGAAASFDGAIALEVLQHFRSLDHFLADCARLLERGGRLAVHDVCADVAMEWERVPFHRRGELPARAEVAGFELAYRKDESQRVVPTFAHLVRGLTLDRSDAVGFFGAECASQRQLVESQFEEVIGHIQALWKAVSHGDLGYETMVFVRR